MNIFEQASKLKVRFDTPKGLNSATVEDLWDLPLTSTKGVSLDGIARGLRKKIRENEEESFVETSTKDDSLLKLKFDLALHVIEQKKKENEDAKNARLKKERRQKILEALAEKENEDINKKSKEELLKELEDL